MHRIYLDHAATTAADPAVVQAMLPYFTEVYGNASSVHAFGRESRRAVEEARRQVASALCAKASEIYFTCGGSESDNWALKGAAFAMKDKGRHIITSAIEHHAVLHTCQWLEKQGFTVTYLPVDAKGRVHPEDVENAITDETILISVMTANNEVGTLQPVEAIGQIARDRGILFHTDAVQAMGAVPVDVNVLHADLLSLSGHKFYGPKGIGVMYLRSGVHLDHFMHGGAQERGQRAGTENLAGIVGLGKAITLAQERMDDNLRIAVLRDRLQEGILSAVPDAFLNGDQEHRLPGNLNLCFPDVDGEALLLRLDLAGIAASGGSACTSGSVDPSHVLLAMGLTHDHARSSLRFSLGRDNTEADVDAVLEVLPGIVQELRGRRAHG
jgi:cysteine desulfurase